MNGNLHRESLDNVRSVDDAIAWCLHHRDSGGSITDRQVIEAFPDFEDQLRDFFDSERALFKQFGNDRSIHSLPKNFGPFALGPLIGRGAFGEVRKAIDTRDDSIVAIKTPHRLSGDEGAKRRFLREARTARQLDHPSIVRIREVGEVDRTPYLSLEFIEGNSLSAWHPDRPVEPRLAAELVSKIASALDHAHSLGIFHRDLSPANVLVDASNVPHILDFGLAKWTADQSTVSLHSDVIGAPAYVSPEQAARTPHDVDGRSDVFSIGAILYELLTAQRPFFGDPKYLLHRIQFESPLQPQHLQPSIPDDLANVCLKCLAKAPEDRYQSASQLQKDLDAFLTGEPVSVSTVDVARWKRQRLVLLGTMVCLAGFLALFFLLSAVR